MDNHYLAVYDRWVSALEKSCPDADLLTELKSIQGKYAEIEDRFYREIEFGTGGLRGVIGAGTNRMNVYVIARATRAICHYLKANSLPLRAAVSYDSRIKSRQFAETAARVFGANGVKAFLYPTLMPVPSLSYATRKLACGIGVMVTASHNPRIYNGYKVYGADGCQITSKAASEILKEILSLDMFDETDYPSLEEAIKQGTVSYIPESVRTSYLAMIAEESLSPVKKSDVTIVYTPLNGAGIRCVPQCLQENGFSDIRIPPEQKEPDGNFPTCPYPNPEIREALDVAIEYAKTNKAGLVLATDPDCDRVGTAIRVNDSYELISGNAMGVLLLDFICRKRSEQGTLPANGEIVTTVVSTPMAEAVARTFGLKTTYTLTGFKYIGERIGVLEREGRASDFVFGFEESYGYLTTKSVRDKDAVNASLLICEMFADYASRGLTLQDGLRSLYAKYGYYKEKLLSFTFEGSSGSRKMEKLMNDLRAAPPQSVGGLAVSAVTDYKKDETGFPKTNMLRFVLPDGMFAAVRPSGTEPKIKIYIAVRGKTEEECSDAASRVSDFFTGWAGQ